MCEDSTANSLKEPQWHKRTGFRFGNLKLHIAVSIWHIIFCLAPLATVLLSPRWSLPSADQLVELVLDTLKWNTQKVPVALGVDVRLDADGPALLSFDADGAPIVERG